jgi:hypothetical protein
VIHQTLIDLTDTAPSLAGSITLFSYAITMYRT